MYVYASKYIRSCVQARTQDFKRGGADESLICHCLLVGQNQLNAIKHIIIIHINIVSKVYVTKYVTHTVTDNLFMVQSTVYT